MQECEEHVLTNRDRDGEEGNAGSNSTAVVGGLGLGGNNRTGNDSGGIGQATA